MGEHFVLLNQCLHANQLNAEMAMRKEMLTKCEARIEEYYDVLHFIDYQDVMCNPSWDLHNDFQLFKIHKGISKRSKSNATEEKEINWIKRKG